MSKEQINEAKIAALQAEAANYTAEARHFNAKAAIDELALSLGKKKEAKRDALDAASRGLFDLDGEVCNNSVIYLSDEIEAYAQQNENAPITLRIFSPGGSVFDGFVLFDKLRDLSNRGHHITTQVLGYAASMGGVLSQAGDTREIGRNAYIMIHNCGAGGFGKTFELEDEVKFMKRLDERMIGIYADRTKMTKSTIRAGIKRKDWWLDSDECVTKGLVDKVIG